MNDNTLVTVHGYSGDESQVRMLMPYYLHHKCPVVIMSPLDAPIKIKGPGIECLFGGKRAYIGQDSLDRQAIHMAMLLNFPHKFFLMNDSDSVCLSPQIPQYLYDRPNVLWSNVVSDMMHDRSDDPTYPLPRLACQPPYFASREVIEKLVAVAHKVPANPRTPFIDWCMMAWAVHAGVPIENVPAGISCPSTDQHSLNVMSEHVQVHGKFWVHSIKTRDALLRIANDRVIYKRNLGRR